MLASVIAAMFSAFITGALARFAVPGPDPMPAWLTVAIGFGGTAIGWGIVFGAIGSDASWAGIASFLAAVGLVILYRVLVQRRPLWGPEAYRFPQRGIGVQQYRERLARAGIDPDTIGIPLTQLQAQATRQPVPARHATDPTENPAHYLGLLEELHDAGVLEDDEFATARMRLLERLRA